MALAADFGTALSVAGYTNVRYYRFGESDSLQICIIPAPGRRQGQFSEASLDFARVDIQIRAASRSPADLLQAETDAYAILALLDRSESVTGCVLITSLDTDPYALGQDETGRMKFLIRFEAIRS